MAIIGGKVVKELQDQLMAVVRGLKKLSQAMAENNGWETIIPYYSVT
jgi:hypothetical protein